MKEVINVSEMITLLFVVFEYGEFSWSYILFEKDKTNQERPKFNLKSWPQFEDTMVT